MSSDYQVPFTPFEEPTLRRAVQSLGDICKGRVKLWSNAHFVLLDLPIDERAARRILPLGLRLKSAPTATLFVADYLQTAFTIPYKEAALLIRVSTPLGKGVHCCWMVVDDDTAQIYGRELLGYPKKTARITFTETEREHVSASVSRRNTEVISLDVSIKDPEVNPTPVLGDKTFNVGGLGQLFAFNPVWRFTPQETIHESYNAKASLQLAHSSYDPIRGLVADFENPLPARFAVVDIMGPGRKILLPVGVAGPRWFARTYNMRYR